MRAKDEGAALALVIIFIITISTWLAAVAFLTQTSSAATTQNSQESARRAQLVSNALAGAIPYLTPNVETRLGTDGTDGTLSCAGKIPDQDVPFQGQTVKIKVTCAEAPGSGFQAPIGAFILTGTGCSGTNCYTGVDGGFAVFRDNNTDCASPHARLEVTAGIVNVSGAWKALANSADLNNATSFLPVDCRTLSLLKDGDLPPFILQPDVSDANCPATKFAGGQCACPTWSPSGNPEWCQSKDFQTELDPTNRRSLVGSFLRSLAGSLDRTSLGNASVGSCSSVQSGPNGFFVPVEPGLVSPATLKLINDAISTCGGTGTSASAAAIWFKPGTYRFLSNADYELPSKTAPNVNTLFVHTTGGGALVMGGTPVGQFSAMTCSKTAPGVQWQFTKATYLEVGAGNLVLCAGEDKPGRIGVAVAAASGLELPSNLEWRGPISPVPAQAFLYNDGSGTGSKIQIQGMFFAPAAWAYLQQSGSKTVEFGGGATLRALTMRLSSSANSAAGVKPPGANNGNRLVQLRFWDTTRAPRGDLGLVQIVLKDFFGTMPSSGYNVTTWRTMW